MMFLGDGQGMDLFVAGGEEGGLCLLPLFTPTLLWWSLQAPGR